MLLWKRMKIALLLIGLMTTLAYGQSSANDSLVTIKGKVKDTTHNVGFYNLLVLNKSVGKGNFGQYDGSFTITVKKSDTIGISVSGYQTIYFSFADSSYKRFYKPVFYLETLEFEGDVVEVKPLKTLEELKEERASISKRELPEVTVTNAISSPITALYMAFSKREKTKRMIAEMEFKDKQEDIVKEILRVYVSNDIIDLDQDQFTEFIRFLNLNPEFLKSATDYELIVYIKGKYEHFKKINEGF